MNSNRLKFMKEIRTSLCEFIDEKLLIQREVTKKERVIDTFPAEHLQEPNSPKKLDSLSEYSLKKNYGLDLRRRRANRNNITL